MRVLVCGGRDFDDVPWLWSELDAIDRQERISCVIDGAQQKVDTRNRIIGADYWAHQWALANNRPVMRFHADWKGYGRSAGPKRNRRMGEEGDANLCLAFPRANGEWGEGTKGMVAIARDLGIAVRFANVNGALPSYAKTPSILAEIERVNV